MSNTLRIVLLIAGIVTAIWILSRIRKARVKVEDAVFWVCLAIALIVIAIVPEVMYRISHLMGIQAPVNCLFLLLLALLIEKVFTLSIKLSQAEDKIEVLSAEVALRTKDLEDKITSD